MQEIPQLHNRDVSPAAMSAKTLAPPLLLNNNNNEDSDYRPHGSEPPMERTHGFDLDENKPNR